MMRSASFIPNSRHLFRTISRHLISHFNIEGGRCEECQGEGIIRVEMQFMADVELTCEACKGMRFRKDILEVKYNGKNIYDMLEMTIDDAIDFFESHPGKN